MTVLTREYLAELGVELDDEQFAHLSEHFDSTLFDRVVDQVVAELTTEQAKELAELQASSSDGQAAYVWLKSNVPDFADIVADEVDILLGEVAEDSDKLSDD